MPRFSRLVQVANTKVRGAMQRLMAAGYMSPQSGGSFTGQGFACLPCDHYRRIQGKNYGACALLQAYVERNACCNRYQFRGVHT